MKRLILVFFILVGCNTPLPTEPLPVTNHGPLTIQYCAVIHSDPKLVDFSSLPDGTQVFTRVNYLQTPPPEWQVFVSDGHCAPPSTGTPWSINIVKDGKIILIGW